MTEPPNEFDVPSDKDAIMSTPSGQSQHILVTANSYDGSSRQSYDGALIEETSAFRSDVELFYDLHWVVWDPELSATYDVRNDASASSVDWASSKVPELRLTNEFEFEDGTTGRLEQDVVASTNQCSILVRNRATFEAARDRTLYTLCNLGIKGHSHEDPNAVQAAHVVHRDGYDVVTATDGNRHVAFAQSRDGYREFDGHRVGRTGHTVGRDRSAWTDIYEKSDGWIDDTESASGDLDAGFGLYLEGAQEEEWLTAIGFATSGEAKAIEHAIDALDNG